MNPRPENFMKIRTAIVTVNERSSAVEQSVVMTPVLRRIHGR